MRPLYTVQGPSSSVASRNRHSGRRWLLGALIAGAVLAIVGLVCLAINWPFKKQAVIDALQESSVRSVTIDHFYRTYFPPGCVAEGISFLHRKHKDKPPLISIRRLTIQGSYARLFTVQRHLSLVRVEGMHVTVPPKGPDGAPSPVMPVTKNTSGR